MYTFFSVFFGTVQTLYNKNISLYKRFFFVFILLFFFPHGMEVVGRGYRWWVKGLICLVPFQASGTEEKVPKAREGETQQVRLEHLQGPSKDTQGRE